ncbi:hypothetical protein BDC45DRAFT_568445 [Circinella umbellata]|nr:hypothetical protein BDC45DRAFT_568445 [Circinella umbellata]
MYFTTAARVDLSGDRREKLLQDLDGWKKSLDAKIFWKEQARKQTIAETRVGCSTLVDAIIHEGPQGSSINNDNSNNYVESSSSSSTNNRDRSTNINKSDDSNHNDRSISERNHSCSNNNINSNSNSSNTSSCKNNSVSNTRNNNNSSSSESSNPGTSTPTEIHTPFIIKHVNVTDTFKQYQEYISSHYPTFTIEKDLQEIMATANILFLASNDHSVCKKKSQLSNFDLMCTEILQELKILDTQENKELFNDDEFIKVTRIINNVAEKTKTIRTAKLELLTLAASMEGCNKASLPRVEILNMDKLGEIELQTTYYDALLSELIADQDKNVALRWPNKSAYEEQTDIRPDAIVSTIMQNDFGYPVGFGEVKPGNSSTTKHSVSLDVLRLGIASKRAIDKWKLNWCFGFMINGFDLTSSSEAKCVTMLEIAQFTYASSLSNLHSFVSMMNLNKLTKVGRCFWNECHATHITRDDDAGVVPVSELYTLIGRTCNRTLGASSRY